MCSKGLLKRALPFFATFAIGLFIASFFVSIVPSFGNGRGFGGRCRNEVKRLRMENEQLKNENLRLRNDIENKNATAGFPVMEYHDWNGRGPEYPIAVEPPAPPMPPVAPRHIR